jgi:hypothetical protein
MQGPVWLPAAHRLFFVSNRLGDLSTSDQHVEMWTLDPATLALARLQPRAPILVANGATNWGPTEVLVTQQVLFAPLQHCLHMACHHMPHRPAEMAACVCQC